MVVAVISGDYGKPRPAVVVQSDFFNGTHASVTICPLTSHLLAAPLFRIPVEPGTAAGINLPSEVMIDKVMSVPREKIGKKAGRLPAATLSRVDDALRLWLGVRQ